MIRHKFIRFQPDQGILVTIYIHCTTYAIPAGKQQVATDNRSILPWTHTTTRCCYLYISKQERWSFLPHLCSLCQSAKLVTYLYVKTTIGFSLQVNKMKPKKEWSSAPSIWVHEEYMLIGTPDQVVSSNKSQHKRGIRERGSVLLD